MAQCMFEDIQINVWIGAWFFSYKTSTDLEQYREYSTEVVVVAYIRRL